MPPVTWIDTHCHPDYLLKSGKMEEAWECSQNAGVRHWIALSTEKEDTALYARAAETYEFISYTVGIHPQNAPSISLESLEKTVVSWDNHLGRRGFVGVGEIGLDYSRLPESLSERNTAICRQKETFRYQLRWAVRHDVPIVLHARDAFQDVLTILEEMGTNGMKVVWHCFCEGPEEIRALNARGMRASFTGIVTFKNTDKVREALRAQGLERLMIETDAPYLTPVPHRGKINTPAYLAFTAKYIAHYLGIPIQELSEHLESNSRKFFRIR
ncbi:MAG: TatD family hydrolase [Puniceicoccales bacterium]|jgi:TatD DNase family protein|nr:TatD family hydrolase [Puniceicoccales bacterium]